jgi:hypothetical protein
MDEHAELPAGFLPDVGDLMIQRANCAATIRWLQERVRYLEAEVCVLRDRCASLSITKGLQQGKGNDRDA